MQFNPAFFDVRYPKFYDQKVCDLLGSVQDGIENKTTRISYSQSNAPRSYSHFFTGGNTYNIGNTNNTGVFVNSANNTSTTVNHTGSKSDADAAREKRKAEETTRIVVGIALAAIGLCASYFLGKAWAEASGVDEQLDNLAELRRDYEDCVSEAENLPKQNFTCADPVGLNQRLRQFDAIISGGEKYFKGIKRKALITLTLRVALVAAAAIGVAGAIAGSGVLMAVGSGGCVTVFAGMLIKWGAESVLKKSQTKKTEALFDQVKKFHAFALEGKKVISNEPVTPREFIYFFRHKAAPNASNSSMPSYQAAFVHSTPSAPFDGE